MRKEPQQLRTIPKTIQLAAGIGLLIHWPLVRGRWSNVPVDKSESLDSGNRIRLPLTRGLRCAFLDCYLAADSSSTWPRPKFIGAQLVVNELPSIDRARTDQQSLAWPSDRNTSKIYHLERLRNPSTIIEAIPYNYHG